jgi:hypothetical protein
MFATRRALLPSGTITSGEVIGHVGDGERSGLRTWSFTPEDTTGLVGERIDYVGKGDRFGPTR